MVCLLCGDPRAKSGEGSDVRGVTVEGIAIRARRASVFGLHRENPPQSKPREDGSPAAGRSEIATMEDARGANPARHAWPAGHRPHTPTRHGGASVSQENTREDSRTGSAPHRLRPVRPAEPSRAPQTTKAVARGDGLRENVSSERLSASRTGSACGRPADRPSCARVRGGRG